MSANGRFGGQLSGAAFLVLVLGVCASSIATAQSRRPVEHNLEDVLRPGTAVWITDAGSREEKVRIVSVSDDLVTTTGDKGTRQFLKPDIKRIRVRHSDSIFNGALIGAGAAVASGLALCTLTETWENCRDDVGPMFRIGALGAGIGIGIDALIRRRTTIYEAPSHISAIPMLTDHSAGVSFTVSF